MMMRMQDYKSKQFWLNVAITLTMAGLLCLLGFWQLQRLAWKTDLINSLNNKEELVAAPNFSAWEVSIAKPQPVLFFGYYIPQGTVIVPKEGQNVSTVYTPFKTTDGVIIMMRRGTIETDKIPGLVLGTHDERTVSVVGVPLPRPRIFPFMKVVQNGNLSWPFLDWSAIRYRFSAEPLAPYVVAVLDEPKNDLNLERAAPEIRNEHLQYAIFWFVMAGISLILFGRFLFSAPRGE